MAQLSVRQAAEQVGVSRQTMFRKIKEGKVSATTDHTGQLQIDTSELLRAFGKLQSPTDSDTTASNRPRASHATPDTPATVAQQIEIERLRAQLELKEAQLAIAQERIEELKELTRETRLERDRMFGLVEQQTRLLAAPKSTSPEVKKRPRKSAKKAS